MKSLARILAQARMERELSLKDVARVAGVSDSAVSRIERGVNAPTLDVLLRLLPPLGLSMRDVCDALEGVAPERTDPLLRVVRAVRAGPWKPEVAEAILLLLAETSTERRPDTERRSAVQDLIDTGPETVVAWSDPDADPAAERAAAEAFIAELERAADMPAEESSSPDRRAY